MVLQLPTQYIYEIVQYRLVIIAILYYWIYLTIIIVASELKVGGLSYEGPKHMHWWIDCFRVTAALIICDPLWKNQPLAIFHENRVLGIYRRRIYCRVQWSKS